MYKMASLSTAIKCLEHFRAAILSLKNNQPQWLRKIIISHHGLENKA